MDISELEYPVESVYFELVQFWKNETPLAVSSKTEEKNSLMFCCKQQFNDVNDVIK